MDITPGSGGGAGPERPEVSQSITAVPVPVSPVTSPDGTGDDIGQSPPPSYSSFASPAELVARHTRHTADEESLADGSEPESDDGAPAPPPPAIAGPDPLDAVLSPFDIEPPAAGELPSYADAAAQRPPTDINFLLRPVENLEAFLAAQQVHGPVASRATASRLPLRSQGARIPVAELTIGSLTRPNIVAVASSVTVTGPPLHFDAVPRTSLTDAACLSPTSAGRPSRDGAASNNQFTRFPPEYYDPVFRKKVRRWMICVWLVILPLQVIVLPLVIWWAVTRQ